MNKKLPESEFEGGGVMPNGIFPQLDGVELSASDQLMLLSSTGQVEDSHAAVDPFYWSGNSVPEPVQKVQRPKRMKQRDRYRESPSPY